MPTPGDPVCKKTVRETCDVQKHTMKCQLPGLLCVKNNTRRGVGYDWDAIRGERRVVFILSNGRGGPLGTAENNRIVKNTYEKIGFPGILCVKKQYAKRVMFKNTP